MTPNPAADTSLDLLKNKIQQHQARIGIIGLGYVGLPLALLYSEQKFPVTGFDIDARKVDTLAKGGSYIFRIAPGRDSGRQGAGLLRHVRLFPDLRDGRHHHLRPHSAERIPRTRPQLHHRHHPFHRSSSARRTAGRA